MLSANGWKANRNKRDSPRRQNMKMTMNHDSKKLSVTETAAGEFEAISISNGNTLWKASALREWLGYVDSAAFKQAIDRAMVVCNTLGIPMHEHFESFPEDGKQDFKLTRFACYLTAMNGDVKKPEVARAQAYFAQMADIVRDAMESADDIERVHVRQEIKERTSSLNSVAQKRELSNYAQFQNAGYMGLYNMGVRSLRRIKGLDADDKRTPLDFMGKRELAANLFRIAETEGRIASNPGIRGQTALEQTARKVGVEVRKVMEVKPEELARQIPEDINVVKKRLKQTQREFKKIDEPKKRDS